MSFHAIRKNKIISKISELNFTVWVSSQENRILLTPQLLTHAGIQRGDKGSGPPLENKENIGFLSSAGPDPLKITNGNFEKSKCNSRN